MSAKKKEKFDLAEFSELAEYEEALKKANALKMVIDHSGAMLKEEDLVEGPVIGIERAAVFVNLKPFGTGIIFGREFINAREIIKKINIGDSVKAKVVSTENEDGYIELSLKEARQALI